MFQTLYPTVSRTSPPMCLQRPQSNESQTEIIVYIQPVLLHVSLVSVRGTISQPPIAENRNKLVCPSSLYNHLTDHPVPGIPFPEHVPLPSQPAAWLWYHRHLWPGSLLNEACPIPRHPPSANNFFNGKV